MSTRALGAAAEDAAIRELRRAGYRIRERNVRLPGGELDAVAEHDGEIVFVEVKARSGSGFGGPADAVTAAKQRRLARLAEAYLALRRLGDRACRFDVVSVALDARGRSGRVEVLRNAVQLDRLGRG